MLNLFILHLTCLICAEFQQMTVLSVLLRYKDMKNLLSNMVSLYENPIYVSIYTYSCFSIKIS